MVSLALTIWQSEIERLIYDFGIAGLNDLPRS